MLIKKIKYLGLLIFLLIYVNLFCNNDIFKKHSAIEGYIEQFSFKDESGKNIDMYSIAGLDLDKKILGLGMYNISFTNGDALKVFSVRKKSYERILRELALQNDFHETNLWTIYNGENTSLNRDEVINFINNISKKSETTYATAYLLSQIKVLKYVKGKNEFLRVINKAKNLGRKIRHMKPNNLNRAITVVSAITNTINVIDKGWMVANGAMLIKAAQYDIAIERMIDLKNRNLINDRAFTEALHSVIKDLENIPEDYWEKLGESIRNNRRAVQEGIFSFVDAVTSIASIFSHSPVTGWIYAISFTIQTNLGIQEWQDDLRDVATSATLYKSHSKQLTTTLDEIDLTINEYIQHLFLKKMKIVLTKGYLSFWEFARPRQKTVRIMISDELDSLDKTLAERRVNRFLSTFENKSDDTNILIGLILDSSGSMQQNDPYNSRKTASKIMVDRVSPENNFIIVDFDDDAKWINSNNWDNWNSVDLISSIERIDAAGGTSIGKGLLKMRSVLEQNSALNDRVGVLLLTDGIGDYHNEADWFAQKGIPIYTISFQGDDNSVLLRNIAASTSGEYMKAYNKGDIIYAFSKFLNYLQGQTTFAIENGTIKQDEIKTLSFSIDESINKFNTTLAWPGSYISLELVDPNNNRIQQNNSNFNWKLGSNYTMLEISNPTPGKWTAQLTGVEIPGLTEDFSFEVNGNSALPISMNVSLQEIGPIELSIGLGESEQEVINVRTKMTVQTPSGNKIDLSDSFVGNKLTFLPSEGKGNYQFYCSLNAEDDSQNIIQRYFKKTVLIGEANLFYLAPVDLTTGAYIETKLGTNVANRIGLTCYIYKAGANKELLASGNVKSISKENCTIKLNNYYSGKNISLGDIVEMDLNEWKGVE